MGTVSESTPRMPLIAHGVAAIAPIVWQSLPSTCSVFLQNGSCVMWMVACMMPLTSRYMTEICTAKRHPKLAKKRRM